ncbi:MAG TPA: GNAT family N-acetyltransferase [Candidatus Fimousia stercorigallinarum]|nr:GNAT family N-acetyltransferase [Candidatus Fimousia stercorigallinarum]
MSNHIILETSRLYLRKIQKNDDILISEILQDIDVMYAWEHAFSNDEVADWINENRMRYERDGYGYWAVIHKMSDRLIGVCGLLKEQADYENYVGLGYIFNKDYWGRGYALESASACVDYAFHTLKVKELTAQIRPNNLPSRKVAEKLGMEVKKEFIKRYRGKEMLHLIYFLEREILFNRKRKRNFSRLEWTFE